MKDSQGRHKRFAVKLVVMIILVLFSSLITFATPGSDYNKERYITINLNGGSASMKWIFQYDRDPPNSSRKAGVFYDGVATGKVYDKYGNVHTLGLKRYEVKRDPPLDKYPFYDNENPKNGKFKQHMDFVGQTPWVWISTPTRTGYTFDGWTISPSRETKSHNNGTAIHAGLSGGDFTITAKWKDNTAPTGSFSPNSRDWGNTNVNVTISGSDSGSGVNRIRYRTETNGTWGSWSEWTSGSSRTVTLSSTGSFRLQAEIEDNSGNKTTITSGYYRIDKTAPSVSASPSSRSWGSSNVTVTPSYSDSGGSGLSTRQYAWSTSTSTPSSWTNYSSGNLTLTNEGSWYLYLRATDGAGNTTTQRFGPYQIDKTAPTISASPSSRGWGNTDVTVTLTYNDAGAGLSIKQYAWSTKTSEPTWDTTLHSDAITVSNWSAGFNSGVSKPEIGYHAKWVYDGIDGASDPCMKFIDRNDQYGLGHRWLGISQNLGTPASLGWNIGDTITISWYQKSDVLGKGAQVGLYHKLNSTGSYSFESNIARIDVTQTGVWQRVSFTTTIGSNWDLNAAVYLYVYGYQGNYGTLWVDNIQAEKGSTATTFTTTSPNVVKNADGKSISNGTPGSYVPTFWKNYTSAVTQSNDGIWYLHIRAVDGAGNSITEWFGPYQIDKIAANHVSHSITGYRYKNDNDYWIRANDTVKYKMRGRDILSGIRYSYARLVGSGVDVRSQHDWKAAADHNNQFQTSEQIAIVKAERTYDNGEFREIEWTINSKEYENDFDVQFYYTDNAGNTFGYANTGMKLRIDATKPDVVISRQNGDVLFSESLTMTVTDSRSGLKTVKYSWSASSSTPSSWTDVSDRIVNNTAVVEINPTIPGPMYLHYYVEDNVGNVASGYAGQYNVIDDSISLDGLALVRVVNPPHGTRVPVVYPIDVPPVVNAGYKLDFAMAVTGADEADIKLYDQDGNRVTMYTPAGAIQTLTILIPSTDSNVVRFAFWLDKEMEEGTILDMEIILRRTLPGGRTIMIGSDSLGKNALQIVGSSKKDWRINLTK